MKLNFESVKILNNKEIQEQKFEWNNWNLPTTIHNTTRIYTILRDFLF